MPEHKLGPYVRVYLGLFLILFTIGSSMYIGWALRGTWGVRTELATHIEDTEMMQDLREWFIEKTGIVVKEHEKIDPKKLGPCGTVRWSDLLRSAKKPN